MFSLSNVVIVLCNNIKTTSSLLWGNIKGKLERLPSNNGSRTKKLLRTGLNDCRNKLHIFDPFKNKIIHYNHTPYRHASTS